MEDLPYELLEPVSRYALLAFLLSLALVGIQFWRIHRANTAHFSSGMRMRSRVVTSTLLLVGGAPLLLYAYYLTIPYLSALEFVDLRIANSKKTLFLLHGWNGGRRTWLNLPTLIANDPRLRDYNITVINYPTFMARRNLNLSQAADLIRVRMRSRLGSGEAFIVAHSMGGIIARQLIIQDRLSAEPMQIRGILSLAAPYQGAALARLGFGLGLTRDIVQDLQPGSSVLTQLAIAWRDLKRFGAARDGFRELCIASAQDTVVTPSSAHSQCHDFTTVNGGGHSELANPADADDERYRLLADWLLPQP